ncbi:MAG: mannitol dehydrogenase family protein [Rhodobacteraceae bacterium]|nr:mannitol dehydrogenase family protein [Paracoccaceae bacterium]
MDHLSNATLPRLPAGVRRPSYDRAAARIGIVHLGVGAFHRAHQAVYTEDAMDAGDTGWAIAGVSLRSPDTRDALGPQDGLYTVAARSAAGDAFRVIGSLAQLLVAPEDPEAVLALMAAPETRIVSLTVTEKGYCHHPATGTLDEAHPDIVHDLANPTLPRSAVGFLIEALDRRRRAGHAPFTALSCDNLPANGETLARVATRFAALRDPALGDWVAAHVAFPSTMVDRIVPATSAADRAFVAETLGLQDAWPIVTEAFSQWVIEDHFPAGRPAWDRHGATLVADVTPFELTKLRLLNASHSSMAYLGYLAGHETVADAMAAPGFAAFLRTMMDEEITPTLPPLPGFDLEAYKQSLLDRFRNPSLRHRLYQIAMDGSQKLPQRLLGAIRDRLAAGQKFDHLAMGVAAWMRYAAGRDEAGQPIPVQDPLAATIRDRLAGRTDAAAIHQVGLSLTEVFGADLPASTAFVATTRSALDRLMADGAEKVVAGG